MTLLQKTWSAATRPRLEKNIRLQIGALCHRVVAGELQVLLITSRGSGRWILPKGWPMDGKSDAEAAMIEAWEEAGVKASVVSSEPLGQFDDIKDRDSDAPVMCVVQVFAVHVDSLEDSFPEAGSRDREWMTPTKAAERVQEDGLRALLLAAPTVLADR